MLEDEEALHHLQRLQGRGVHRDRAARLEARPQRHPGGREVLRARADRRSGRAHRRQAVDRACAPASSARGAGHWEASGGDRSKFGLGARELFEAIEFLRESEPARLPRAPALPPRQPDLLHPQRQGGAARGRAHLRRALQARARRCATSTSAAAWASTTTARRPTSPSSMNYTMQEYANDIVFGIMELCDAEQRAAPDPRLRVGPRARRPPRRAGRRRPRRRRVHASERCPRRSPKARPARSATCSTPIREVSRKNLLEAYHDAARATSDEVLSLFNLGHLTLEQRVLAEDIFWALRAQDPAPSSASCPRFPRSSRTRARARRHLLLQLLGLPVAARLLGDRPALPGPADPPPQRGADAARRARRHHLRLRRQDRPLHRPARRQGRARAPPAQAATTTTSASSWSAPTRRSSATCTTSSATPTPSTSRSARRAATTSTTCSPATPCRRAQVRELRPRRSRGQRPPLRRDRAAQQADHPRGVAATSCASTSRVSRATPTSSASEQEGTGRSRRAPRARRRPAPAPDVPSRPLSDRRPRPGRRRLARLDGRRRFHRLAGPAARADRHGRLALQRALGLRRQPAAHLARGARRRRAPAGRRPSTPWEAASRTASVDYEPRRAARSSSFARPSSASSRGRLPGARGGARALRRPRAPRRLARRLGPLLALKRRTRRRRLARLGPGAARPPAAGAAPEPAAVLAGEVRFADLLPVPLLPPVGGVRGAAESRGIRILGDVPIYVAPDSADVWANRTLFDLAAGRPPARRRRRAARLLQRRRAALGQSSLPLGRARRREGFRWWVDRLRAQLELARRPPARPLPRLRRLLGGSRQRATTARRGKWVKGPGEALFHGRSAKRSATCRCVAEDLGRDQRPRRTPCADGSTCPG